VRAGEFSDELSEYAGSDEARAHPSRMWRIASNLNPSDPLKYKAEQEGRDIIGRGKRR